MADARDLVGIEERLAIDCAGDQARHRNRIAADVENAAAGHIIGKQPVFRIDLAHVEAEGGADDTQIADHAALDKLDQLRRLWVDAIHEGFAGKNARLPGFVIDGFCIEGGKRDRLFDEHMLAGTDGLDRPFGMAGVRRGDIDSVDVLVGEQGLIAIDDACAGELVAETRLVRVAAGNRHQLAAARMGDAIGKSLCDPAGADDAPADWCLSSHGTILS